MTEKEIIKGLRQCSDACQDCGGCPYVYYGGIECRDELHKDLIHLINSYKIEIDRLNGVILEMSIERATRQTGGKK